MVCLCVVPAAGEGRGGTAGTITLRSARGHVSLQRRCGAVRKQKEKAPVKQLNPGSERSHCLQPGHVTASFTKAAPPLLLCDSAAEGR